MKNEKQTTSKESDCAIIIQGPVITKNKFTLETVKLYLKLHPNAYIILSTWDDTSKEVIELFNKLSIFIKSCCTNNLYIPSC